MYSVYRIINIRNSRVYYGSSSQPEVRKAEHFGSLRERKHVNRFLQSDYNIYGESAFVFEIIFDGFNSRQQMLIKEYELILKNKGPLSYNIDITCPVLVVRKGKKPKKEKLSSKYVKPIRDKEPPKYTKGRIKDSLKKKFVNVYPNLTAIAERKKQREARCTSKQ